MSTCILTGFAKKKHKVGTSYACNGSDLPTTQTLSAVQVSGPYEAPPTLPETEVSYTIIGYTQCGDTIRRISTKTYSSRTVSQYKAIAAFLRDTLAPNNVTAVGTYYGTTINLAHYALESANIGVVPDPYVFQIGGVGAICTATGKYDNALAGFGITYHSCLRNGIEITPPSWQSYQSTDSGPIATYYIDVNEVLTYDLV